MMSLLTRKGLGSLKEAKELAANEWKLSDLARELGIALETLRGWAIRDRIQSRQTPIQRYWILCADELQTSPREPVWP